MNAELRYHIDKNTSTLGCRYGGMWPSSHVSLAVKATVGNEGDVSLQYVFMKRKLECSSRKTFPKSLKSSSQPSSGAAARLWFMNSYFCG